MSDREKIELGVKRLRSTKRGQVVLDHFVRGLFWGAIPAALCILLSRLFILPISEYLLGGILLGAVAIGFTVRGALLKITPLAVANDIDVSLGLRERVSSAIALGEGVPAKDPFVKALLKDAAKTVEKAQLRRVYPWRMPRAWLLALPALLIAAGLSFVPQLNWFVKHSDRAEAKLIQTEGQKLKQLAKQALEEAKKKQDPVLEQQAKEIKRVGEKLDQQQVKKKEALKELQKLEDKLREQQQSLVPQAEQALSKELGKQLKEMKTTQELGQKLSEGNLEEFVNQLGQLMNNLEQGQLSPDQEQMLKEMLQALDKALQSEAGQQQGNEKLKDILKNLQQQIQNEQQMKQALQELMQNFEKDLNNLNQQMSQSGQKELKEQSQNLQNLMNQMKEQMAQQGSMDPQTLQQMQQQLSQAQQQIQQNQNLSQQQQQQMSQAAQKVQDYFQQSQQQQGQQGQQGQEGQQGQMQQQNQQVMQNRQNMAQSMNQQNQCQGGT
ncbi:hypothetical protein IT575_15670 [bacterium]|nr:hypothetical protein [bacterium]